LNSGIFQIDIPPCPHLFIRTKICQCI
jgi:hypothetical protein